MVGIGVRASYLVGTVCVNLVNKIPVGILHILEADVTEDSSIVNENVNATKVLDRGLNDRITILHAVVVGNSLTASGTDLLNYDICGLQRRQGQRMGDGKSEDVYRLEILLMTCPRQSESHRGR